ncbi:MAG: hypothetical protein ACOCRO_05860 [Halanaerobiales bacterium]
MKISGRNVPFWAFRYGSRKGRVLFSIYRIIEASANGIKADKRIGSLHYGPTSVTNIRNTFSYNTFVKNFYEIDVLNDKYKRNLLQTILENYK